MLVLLEAISGLSHRSENIPNKKSPVIATSIAEDVILIVFKSYPKIFSKCG